MTLPTATPNTPARPWTFTLMTLTALGGAAIVWMILSSAIARREDGRRHDAVRAELLRLDQAQSEWYSHTGRYALALGTTSAGDTLGFTPSPGVQLRFESQSAESWNAVVGDSLLTTSPATCGIFRGPPEASPHRLIVRPGTVACW
ncbi:MAG: hypothetical protein V4558_10920 [Gemmatimonadota bacterium]